MITIAMLEKHQAAINKKFGNKDMLAMGNVRTSYFSIARYYNGCKVNGQSYTYFQQDDILVRDDVVKFLKKLDKEQTK